MSRRRKLKADGIRNIVNVSDTHCGCGMALCPPRGVKLDGAGWYEPSEFQRKLLGIWDHFWNVWVPQVTHGEEYAVVLNGDAIDGVHHNSTTQITHNTETQCAMAVELLKPVVERCSGRFYMTRGTEVHVGQSGKDEEHIAKELHAIPDKDGRYSRWELNKLIGPDRKGRRYVCNFMHHIGTTSSTQHETSALNSEIAKLFVNSGQWKHEPPSVISRAHRHHHSEVRIPGKDGYIICFVTPGWQGKTPFLYRVAARNNVTQFGGSLIRIGGEELHTRHFVREIEKDQPE